MVKKINGNKKMQFIDSFIQLEQMCHMYALSGFEEDLIKFMREQMLQYTKDVRVDKLGNVISRFQGTDSASPTVMIFSHMDEVGFIVRNIDENGFIRFSRVGGIPEKSMPAQRVVLSGSKGRVTGFIGAKSHHLTLPDEKYKVVRVDDSYIDIGISSREEAKSLGITPGVPINYAGYYQEIQNDVILAKSIDNRAGCFTLLQLARLLSSNKQRATIYLVGTVQEEFNIRGAVTAGYVIDPDLAISVDGCQACDTPDLRNYTEIQLGKGPSVCHYSFHGRGTLNGLIPNPKLIQFVTDSAESENLPLQHNVFLGGLTDSSYLAVIREGIPCVDIGIPKRYSHAPIEMASKTDLENTVGLLFTMIHRMDNSLDLSRG